MDTVIKNTTSFAIDIVRNNFLPRTVYKWKAEESGTRQSKGKYYSFLIASKKDRKEILKDIKLLQDKKLANDVRSLMQHDIFQKWKEFYSRAN